MRFSVVAWSESIDAGGTLQAITAVADQHLRTEGDQVVIGELNRLIGAWSCCGATHTRAQLRSPSLRRINNFSIEPLTLGIVPPANSNAFIDYGNSIPLDINEGLEAWQNGNPAAAEQVSVCALIADGAVQPVSDKHIPVYFTASITMVAGAWAGGNITFDTELPVGKYKVIGANVVAAGAVAFRFIPVGASHRPGGIASQLLTGIHQIPFRDGWLGEWFTFDTNQPPQLELLGSAAGAVSVVGVMDVVIP